jgi:NADH pyrophosphatase NudC (nudix superfamily)
MSQTLIPHSEIILNLQKGSLTVYKENRAKLASFFTEESLAKQDRKRMEKVKKRNSRIKKKRKKRIQKRNNMPILVMDLPQLSNEITLADLRQWMRDAADNTAIQAVRKSPEINLDSEELLDAIWKSKEPRPTSQEMTALFLLSEEVGTTSDSPDDWIVVILPLLSYPSELHPYIKLNLREASFQLDERIEVVDRRSESCTES